MKRELKIRVERFGKTVIGEVLDMDDSFRKDKDLGQMNAGVTIIVITWNSK